MPRSWALVKEGIDECIAGYDSGFELGDPDLVDAGRGWFRKGFGAQEQYQQWNKLRGPQRTKPRDRPELRS
jgi:hypothetical protein